MVEYSTVFYRFTEQVIPRGFLRRQSSAQQQHMQHDHPGGSRLLDVALTHMMTQPQPVSSLRTLQASNAARQNLIPPARWPRGLGASFLTGSYFSIAGIRPGLLRFASWPDRSVVKHTEPP
ncbi:hypothetical protein OEZ86_008157 [Tetradesmus obliquus]|nr:hypothetical protein OEZ86_008157 [Tetradesmus obliquus]